MEDKELKRTIEKCLREHEKEYPNGYGLHYAELRNEVVDRTGDSTLSTERFGSVLNGLMKQRRVLMFGAIRMGFMTFCIKEP